MKHKEQQDYNNELDSLIIDLQSFIELSFHQDENQVWLWSMRS